MHHARVTSTPQYFMHCSMCKNYRQQCHHLGLQKLNSLIFLPIPGNICNVLFVLGNTKKWVYDGALFTKFNFAFKRDDKC